MSFRNNYREALPHYLTALEMDRKEFSRKPEMRQRLDLATSLSEIGGVQLDLKQAALALPYLEESAQLRREAFGIDPSSERVRYAYSNVLQRLGRAQCASGRWNEGERAFQEAKKVALVVPVDHRQLARILAYQAGALASNPAQKAKVVALEKEALVLFAEIAKSGKMDSPLRVEWDNLKRVHAGSR